MYSAIEIHRWYRAHSAYLRIKNFPSRWNKYRLPSVYVSKIRTQLRVGGTTGDIEFTVILRNFMEPHLKILPPIQHCRSRHAKWNVMWDRFKFQPVKRHKSNEKVLQVVHVGVVQKLKNAQAASALAHPRPATLSA